MSDYYLWDGESGRDWSDTNERLKSSAVEESYTPPAPRRRISRMPKLSKWFHLPDERQEKQLPTGNPLPRRGSLPEGLEVFEASRTYLVDGTQVERLGIKNGDRYVTVVRYDGNNNDMVVVDGKGNAVSTNQEYVNGIVVDKLNLEES